MCEICKQKEATKMNSHIIPSFIIAKTCSYDGSGKRDKDVLFTIDNNGKRLHLGQLPDSKIEELVDTEQLTDERIDNEFKDNTATRDNIFCPECEANLSKYLESIYSDQFSKGKEVPKDVSYIFWVSIVWRMCISGDYCFQLSEDIKENLGDSLHKYMLAETEEEKLEIIKNCRFSYRLLRAQSLPYSEGYFTSAETHGNTLTFFIGDYILCAQFDDTALSNDYNFYGLEESIKSAAINDGTQDEQVEPIEDSEFNKAIYEWLQEKSDIVLEVAKKEVDLWWLGLGLGNTMPDNIFQLYMTNVLKEDIKIGDTISSRRRLHIFLTTLISLGIIQS